MRTNRSVVELAAAKLNLTLAIVGRRADGYHLIDSVMVPVGLCDRLRVSVSQQGGGGGAVRLSVRGARVGVPRGPSNLAVRAALAFRHAAGERGTVSITLDKTIPVAAGLGGGSSDAAAVLRALDRLWPGRVSTARLRRLAAELGADVPFFLDGRPARVTGIGEVVRRFRGRVPRWFAIAVPRPGVSTAWAYRAFRLTRPHPGSRLRRLRYSVSHPVNDLEAAVLPRRPDIRLVKRRLLEAGARTALMSGSGSAVYGTFAARRQASDAVGRLPRTIRVFVVSALTTPPKAGRRSAGRSPSW